MLLKHQTPTPKTTYFSLILANIMPLVGVLAMDWQVADVVLFYWLETIIIGLYNAVKIAYCQGRPARDEKEQAARMGGVFPWLMAQSAKSKDAKTNTSDDGYKDVNELSKAFVIIFFLLHYNVFAIFQFAMIAGLLGMADKLSFSFTESIWEIVEETKYFWSSLLLIVFSHGHSFVTHYLGDGEYRIMDKGSLMMQPYSRIFIQQFVVIVGAFLVMILKAPVWFVVILVLLKTAADLMAHRWSHPELQADSPYSSGRSGIS